MNTIQNSLVYKRGVGKNTADYKSKDLFKFYNKNTSNHVLMSQSKFSRILREFYDEVIKLVIYNNMEFIMPCRLGTLRVRRKQVTARIDENGNVDSRNLSPNWKKTKALWVKQYPGLTTEEISEIPNKHIIREMNAHSDGYRYMWYWDRIISNVTNQNAYKLNMTRTHDEELTNAIKTIPNLEYYD